MVGLIARRRAIRLPAKSRDLAALGCAGWIMSASRDITRSGVTWAASNHRIAIIQTSNGSGDVVNTLFLPPDLFDLVGDWLICARLDRSAGMGFRITTWNGKHVLSLCLGPMYGNAAMEHGANYYPQSMGFGMSVEIIKYSLY